MDRDARHGKRAIPKASSPLIHFWPGTVTGVGASAMITWRAPHWARDASGEGSLGRWNQETAGLGNADFQA